MKGCGGSPACLPPKPPIHYGDAGRRDLDTTQGLSGACMPVLSGNHFSVSPPLPKTSSSCPPLLPASRALGWPFVLHQEKKQVL